MGPGCQWTTHSAVSDGAMALIGSRCHDTVDPVRVTTGIVTSIISNY